MTIAETLFSVSYYPVPDSVANTACITHDLNPTDEADNEVCQSREYELAKMEVYKWLYYAPLQISENGVSFRMSQEEKANYRMLCNQILEKYEMPLLPTIYGYKGSRF